MTPLLKAAANKHADMVEFLLARRADPNHRDRNGNTALGYAIPDLDTMRALLDHNADVNAPTHGSLAPILRVLTRRQLSVRGPTQLNPGYIATVPLVALLLKYDPDLDVKDSEGNTPLLLAIKERETRIVETLLAAGANPNTPGGPQGAAPIFSVLLNADLMKLLLDHGANLNVIHPSSGLSPLESIESEIASIRAGRGSTFIAGRSSTSSDLPVTRMEKSAALLRQAGAEENLSLRSGISIGRGEGNIRISHFRRSDADINGFTLLELIADFYLQNVQDFGQGQASQSQSWKLPFPSFTNVVIRSFSDPDRTPIELNVLDILMSGDPTKDPWLDWGDFVEISERNHLPNQTGLGLPKDVQDALKSILERYVEVRVNDQSIRVRLQPRASNDLSRASLTFFGNTTRGGVDESTLTVQSFWLEHVLRYGGLLRASSDLTRVKVKRTDPITKEIREIEINLDAVDPVQGTDLWLRSGDVIEVPDEE